MQTAHLILSAAVVAASVQLGCTIRTGGSAGQPAAASPAAPRRAAPARPVRPPPVHAPPSHPPAASAQRSGSDGNPAAPPLDGSRAAPAVSSIAPPPAPAELPATDSEPARLFLAELAKPGEALGTQTAPPRVTAIGLENTARGEASGMTPDGPIWSIALREAQRATTNVTIAPDECVTFIAQGGLGVIELDLFLTMPGARPVRLLAQDRRSGPIAVIGGRSGCFAHSGPAPLPTELHVRLRRGSGIAVVRAYRRPAAPQSSPPPAPPR